MGEKLWGEELGKKNKQGEPLQARPVIRFPRKLKDAIAYDGKEGYCDEREEESLEYLLACSFSLASRALSLAWCFLFIVRGYYWCG